MDIEQMIQRAKILADIDAAAMDGPGYRKTMAWLCYLGVLRHKKIAAARHKVTLGEALEAGMVEPRILEVLPAVLIVVPGAIEYSPSEVPEDLANVLTALNEQGPVPEYRGVPGGKCAAWVNAPCMEIARRRVNFHTIPRRAHRRPRKARGSKVEAQKTDGVMAEIAEIVRAGRMTMALTQRQLAEKYDVSLRVLRDLEQGKSTASFQSVSAILHIFGRRLHV